jgi:hypothetical protein
MAISGGYFATITVGELLSESDTSRSGQSSESKLDALIARLHGLGASKNVQAPTERRAVESQDLSAGLGHPSSRAVPPSSTPNPSRPGSMPAKILPRASGPAEPVVDFSPSRDEPWRPQEPGSLKDTGVRESTIEGLVMRFLLSCGEASGREIANQVKLPFRIVAKILEAVKSEHRVALKAGTETNDYVYVLTESGRLWARQTAVECTYYGACPVSLADYIASVRMQSIEGQAPNREDLKRSFADLLIDPSLFARLGPAISSGRGMFLFGYPGNGKTSIAERVTNAFGQYVWIPSAIEIEGAVMRVYDPMLHEIAQPKTSGGLLDLSLFDKRWVRIKRPTIVVGGELTMEMLEVQQNEKTHINEAPLQTKSNCGTLVIDDFGRQKMSIDKLLNRWIIPLEKRYDFLNLPGGKKIEVPFDQLVVFSTNLEPKDLVDDAFLRRIPYKIEIANPSEENFRKLFEIMCRVLKIPFNKDAVDYLIDVHYRPIDRPFRNCQPRDLLLQVKSYCQYNELPLELRNDYFDFAVENYFSIM